MNLNSNQPSFFCFLRKVFESLHGAMASSLAGLLLPLHLKSKGIFWFWDRARKKEAKIKIRKKM